MREAYKIKNAYVTAVVVGIEFDLFTNKNIFVLSDLTRIDEATFRQLYNKVDGKKLGDSLLTTT